MTINYQDAFFNLRQRRLGSDHTYLIEDYEALCNKKKKGINALKYALGAMKEVDKKFTSRLIEDGERVKSCLEKKVNADYRYQGSVPMNIHIRSNSDIDLLVINTEFYSFSAELSARNERYNGGGFDGVQSMAKLRQDCEDMLERQYYAANVDKSGAKSINISGGSFSRSVDVVPANWHDDLEYNYFDNNEKRAVKIFNKFTRECFKNKPFLFRDKIVDKNTITDGRSSKAIRLLKNIKEDSNKKIKDLSSYDIASLIWNMPNHFLTYNRYESTDLAILIALEEWLDSLSDTQILLLDTPDNSRRVIDSIKKKENLNSLHQELQNLIKAIYKDIQEPIQILTNDGIDLNNAKNKLLEERFY